MNIIDIAVELLPIVNVHEMLEASSMSLGRSSCPFGDQFLAKVSMHRERQGRHASTQLV